MYDDTMLVDKAYYNKLKEQTTWVSVKDKLPEHCQEVIVYWNNIVSGNYEVHVATYNADFEYFYIHKAGLAVKDVTHWMPLPKMPEKPYQEWGRIKKEREL